MSGATALILHRPVGPDSGRLERLLGRARAALAERHRAGFLAAGASTAVVVAETGEEPFGVRLRRLVGEIETRGLIVLGSGSLALARPADRRTLVAAATSDEQRATANNRYSADVVAIADAAVLRAVPDLPADNALPRWLAEVAGLPVRDLRERWWLAVDLDSPADLLLPGVRSAVGLSASDEDASVLSAAADRLRSIQSVMADARAELLVAGRSSAGTLSFMERRAACRVRALIEERGLRASSALAQGRQRDRARHPAARPPRSLLGALLDRDGPASLGQNIVAVCDAAVVDTRVLLAHRLGGEEASWPPPEDRFASDLLLPAEVGDPWLRALTEAAVGAPVPIALGGHTLVGPGLRLLAARRP